MMEIEKILDKVDTLEKSRIEENGFTNFVGNVYNKLSTGKSFADSNAERAQKALDKQANQDAEVLKKYDMLIKAAPYIEKIAQACSQDAKTANGIVNTLDNIANNQVQGPADVVKMAKNVRAMLNNTSNGKNSLSQMLKDIVNANGGKDIDLSKGLANGLTQAKAKAGNQQGSESGTANSENTANNGNNNNQNSQNGQNSQADQSSQTNQNNQTSQNGQEGQNNQNAQDNQGNQNSSGGLTDKDIELLKNTNTQGMIIKAISNIVGGQDAAQRIINALVGGQK